MKNRLILIVSQPIKVVWLLWLLLFVLLFVVVLVVFTADIFVAVGVGPRNLNLKFGQNRVSYS